MKTVFKGLRPYRVFGLRNGRVGEMFLSNDADSVNTRFRYFMIKVDSLQWGSTIQFSKLRFYCGSPDNCYPWCNDMTTFSDLFTYVQAVRADGSVGTSGEEAENGLMGLGGEDRGNDGLLYGKMCYTDLDFPAYYVYDVDRAGTGRKIDIATYSRWCWHSSNDTSENDGRNMKDFSLYMSDDRTNWTLMDKAEDVPGLAEDYALVYSGSVAPRYETVGGKKAAITMEMSV